MDPEMQLLEMEESMDKAVNYLLHEFASVRTGKASPALVENLEVDAYGTIMRLKQMAVITTPEARLLVIQPFDGSTTKAIEKAIKESRLGINPSVDGKIIRLPIPELSEERRRDLVKAIKGMAEDVRVRIRSARRDGIDAAKKAEKAGDISEDQLADFEAEAQKLTDKANKQVDEHVAHKEAEIMKV
ncbi:MAG: ribosome recycling factor [Verrucomicrobia bacterium]|nr:ribosome recycling factor [Verrucomicrobiota bacterium]